ncbi:MAG: sensor histidine kinase, partial [Actinomycetota bacterium]
YAVAWLVSAEPDEAAEAPARAPLTALQLAGLGAVALGGLLALRELGLWAGDALVWPLALAAVGSAVIWARGGVGSAGPATAVPRLLEGRAGPLRVAVGVALVGLGLAAFIAANDVLMAAGGALMAVVVTVLGVGLIAGPWGVRVARQLAAERRERIRSEERAEMAAHLHDSVLHTLALIQRADDGAEMASLARAQERELRAWLYGGRDAAGAETLTTLVEDLAGRVERLHRVPVEAVVVGDAPLDERVRALVDAAGEAVVNAARHAGADRVSLYLEAQPDVVAAYVRDEGKGFDPDLVPADRHGIAASIRGRMARHGGSAEVHSVVGEGTEVVLELPREVGA